MSEMPQRYTDDEVREILRRAAVLDEPSSDLDEQALHELAMEAGISHEALATAKAQWLAERRSPEEEAERRAFEKARRGAFYGHLFTFIVMNFFFMVMSLMNDQVWFIWPLLGWGIGLTAHAFNLLQKSGPAYENELAQWRMSQPSSQRQLPR